jgi:flagellar hook-length control protein FliK
VQAAPSPATPEQLAALTAAATAPAQQSVESKATSLAKSSEARDAAANAATAPVASAAKAPAQATAPRHAGPKAAPAAQAAKENVALAAAADAPDAPAPAPTPQTGPASAQHAAQSQHAAIDASAVRTTPAAAQVAREIVRRFDGGNTRFELRLDPPELGRVEVRLEVSRDHRVNAVIAADSPQALTELARHARELEQMLQGAGLELGDSGLSFDLRQGGEGAEQENDGGARPGDAAASDESQSQAQTQARPIGFERWRGVRVNMMV